jgi:hypothetical protein
VPVGSAWHGEPVSDAVSTLCQSCGLCCDGTLFAFVTLTAAEAESLHERDLAIESRANGVFRLHQRCGALRGKTCSVYERRPAACSAYVCLLAQALAQGEVGLAEARELVEGAHARLASVRAHLPGIDGSPVPHVRRSMSGEAPVLDDDAASAWIDAREYLRRHFIGRQGMS